MKWAYRIALLIVWAAIAVGVLGIFHELHQANKTVEDIRSQIPMSLLGN